MTCGNDGELSQVVEVVKFRVTGVVGVMVG